MGPSDTIGVPASDLEGILAQVTPSMHRDMDGRLDHPVLIAHEGKASIQLALNAALPNQRKRSLECIRCVGASLKAGAYRSARLYFQAAVAHQLRFYQQPVSPFIRAVIRDVTRSIRRRLGPASVKKGFNLLALVNPRDDLPFDIDSVAHITDMMIIGSWFMLRELEISFARDSHLSLHGNEVHLLVPVHKTSTQGSLTVRVLQCPCNAQLQPLCPWHATERHLIRVVGHPRRAGDTCFALFSDNQGKTLSKYLLIQAFRKTLQAAGISTQVHDAHCKLQDLFGGHCLRVTGQFLACAGVETPLIQLLGRWSSTAVERYVQSAPLNIIPQIPSRILSEGGGNMGTTRSPGLSAQVYKLKCANFRPPFKGHQKIWSFDHGAQWFILVCQKRFRMNPGFGGPGAVGNTVSLDFSGLQCCPRHSGSVASVLAPS